MNHRKASNDSDFSSAVRRMVEGLHALAPAGKRELWNRGALANLRRGLRDADGWSAQGAQVVERWIDVDWELRRTDRVVLYWIAALFGDHPYYVEHDKAPVAPDDGIRFGISLAKTLNDYVVADANDAGASIDDIRAPMNRTFVRLLDSDRVDLFPKLQYLIARFRGSETPIDWARLANDLARWDSEDHLVQRRWARDWWNPRSQEADSGAGTKSVSGNNA